MIAQQINISSDQVRSQISIDDDDDDDDHDGDDDDGDIDDRQR